MNQAKTAKSQREISEATKALVTMAIFLSLAGIVLLIWAFNGLTNMGTAFEEHLSIYRELSHG